MTDKAQDTEQKIKEAARVIFLEKGFSATKTRDIAEAAGINLALLNYYFRSKKKLFEIIMLESLQLFFSGLVRILNAEETTFTEKVSLFAEHYIDFLLDNPNVALFIINSARENPAEFLTKMGMLEVAGKSVFIRQISEAVAKGEIKDVKPLHIMANMMSLVVFPFVAQPMISSVWGLEKEAFDMIMQERKRLIPMWIESMLMKK